MQKQKDHSRFLPLTQEEELIKANQRPSPLFQNHLQTNAEDFITSPNPHLPNNEESEGKGREFSSE